MRLKKREQIKKERQNKERESKTIKEIEL